VIGLGKLGSKVSGMAKAFGMNVIAWSPNLTPERCKEVGVSYATKEELFATADIVTIHVVLSQRSRGLVGAAELARMKPTSYLVNTARGPIVDEKALADALAEGRIAGAGLDVFEREPVVEASLIGMPNVVLTPHIGSAVAELRESMAHIVVDNIVAVLEGRRPPNCCNPEIYEGTS
jgi:phosphoglycerate dehydrogenase-like enzyme